MVTSAVIFNVLMASRGYQQTLCLVIVSQLDSLHTRLACRPEWTKVTPMKHLSSKTLTAVMFAPLRADAFFRTNW